MAWPRKASRTETATARFASPGRSTSGACQKHTSRSLVESASSVVSAPTWVFVPPLLATAWARRTHTSGTSARPGRVAVILRQLLQRKAVDLAGGVERQLLEHHDPLGSSIPTWRENSMSCWHVGRPDPSTEVTYALTFSPCKGSWIPTTPAAAMAGSRTKNPRLLGAHVGSVVNDDLPGATEEPQVSVRVAARQIT